MLYAGEQRNLLVWVIPENGSLRPLHILFEEEIMKNLYPTCWTEKLRDKIRYRDSNTCRICKMRQGDYKKKFVIHHLDLKKENCKPLNLITLCPKCHRELHYLHFQIKRSIHYTEIFKRKFEDIQSKIEQSNKGMEEKIKTKKRCEKCGQEMKRVSYIEIKNKIIQEDFYCKKCKKIIEMHFKLDKSKEV